MLETAERLGTFAGTIDRAAVDRAWWYLMLNDEHSYGTSGYQGRRVFETWMQHRDWIERAAAIASNELAKAVAKLGLATGTTGVPPVVNGQDARSPSVNGQDARCPSDVVARICEDWLDPYAKKLNDFAPVA